MVDANETTSHSTRKKRGLFSIFRGKKQEKQTLKPVAIKTTTANTTTNSVHSVVTSTNSTKASDVPNPKATVVAVQKGILKTDVVEPKVNSNSKQQATSWLCRTKRFQRMCDMAFDAIDTDQSGSVDEKELYSGLLLIHLKLGLYAGPAACRPIDRKKCKHVFEKMDRDKSGSLDRVEFREVMMVLFSNVLLRVLAQWSLTLIIVPLVAAQILNVVYLIGGAVYNLIANLNEYSEIADKIELALEATSEKLINALPDAVLDIFSKMKSLLELVPQAMWDTIPLTLISTILGILVVPWIIFKIDDFFQYLADRKAKT